MKSLRLPQHHGVPRRWALSSATSQKCNISSKRSRWREVSWRIFCALRRCRQNQQQLCKNLICRQEYAAAFHRRCQPPRIGHCHSGPRPLHLPFWRAEWAWENQRNHRIRCPSRLHWKWHSVYISVICRRQLQHITYSTANAHVMLSSMNWHVPLMKSWSHALQEDSISQSTGCFVSLSLHMIISS